MPRIHVRAVLHFARRRHQPGFARVSLVAKPAPAFVVVEVLVVGVVLVDAVDRIGLVHVPADKVDGVVEVFAIGSAAAGAFLVVGPDFIFGLRITRGGRDAAPRDHPQQVFARGLGVVAVAGFLIHDREGHLNRHAPAFLRDLRSVVPVAFFAEDFADVFRRAGRRGAAPAQ